LRKPNFGTVRGQRDMTVMKNINDPGSTFRDHVSKIRDKLRQLEGYVGDKQVSQHIHEIVAEISLRVKACEREWTKATESFEGEIEELRLANEMLQAKGALHEAVFENSDDGIVITTKTGNFLAVNQGFARLVGCKTKEEVFARKIQDFYANPGQRVQMKRKVDRSGVATNFELKLRRIDGSEVDTLHTINVRLDGQGHYRAKTCPEGATRGPRRTPNTRPRAHC
jgi:PAS domain S-box-containing protein